MLQGFVLSALCTIVRAYLNITTFTCYDNPPSPAVNAGKPEQRAPACSNNGWQTLHSNGTSMIGPNSWAEQAVSIMREGLLAWLQFQTHAYSPSPHQGCQTAQSMVQHVSAVLDYSQGFFAEPALDELCSPLWLLFLPFHGDAYRCAPGCSCNISCRTLVQVPSQLMSPQAEVSSMAQCPTALYS